MIDETEVRLLREQLEAVEHERDSLLVGIAEATEALGHSGGTVDDLRDAVGQLERLLVGKDVDAGLDLVGIAGQVEALVGLVGLVWFDGGWEPKTEPSVWIERVLELWKR